MDRQQLSQWVADYERAWRTAGVTALADLFTPDATYRQSPYAEPVAGPPSIGRMWDDERSGPDEVFTMTADIVAVEEDTAVVRVEVRYGNPVEERWRDLWVIRFAADGRCREFEEWPFSPPSSR
ncbi:YybH family protein [Rugosimonospora africana]|uniref:SnoaL-like domain-containing protein n=1 Tax=Rugosimonospora africana TaxID=556532 RepID=A0A8J3QSR0_9ACTN|nr:nuclear transport factor 2 family protein [Rugosimonospora africana]GIH15542.1 hypothetical protein Raf01_37140 [Rugosimonospora africana]